MPGVVPHHPPVRLFTRCWLAAAALALATAAARADDAATLADVLVTATFREEPARIVAASVTVLGADTLRTAGTEHLEDVLGLVPNLDWSAGSSRPRYFQIRGIGELEQYEGAPNPSVGLLVDDIDFSGLGMVATLFDLAEVEVLRGPQGTRYGANALGGIIYARSQPPGDALDARGELSIGDSGTRSAGFVLSGPVAALGSSARLAVQRYHSDGFYRNDFLHRNTDMRDELTARLRWRYSPSASLTVDLSVLHGALANGYDAFATDNSRRVRSDHPGEDTQRATGVSLRATYTGSADHVLTLIATDAHSRSTQAYDGDWGNPLSWSPYTYDFVYRADSDRVTRSLEARFARERLGQLAWLAGAYAQELTESIASASRGTYADPADAAFDFTTDDGLKSRYRARNLSAFGQLDGELTPTATWSAGMRLERREATYRDSATSFGAAAASNRFAPGDSMAGGHLSLSYHRDPQRTLYASLSRGYKAGGFNLSQGLADAQREFRPESLVNVEVGHKFAAAEGTFELDTTLFYMQRRHMQVRTSVQLVAGDPNTFVFLTTNAGGGANFGLESSLRSHPTARLEIGGSLGLLNTRFNDFTASDGASSRGRAQAHAPSWQAAVNLLWRRPGGWFARIDLTGRGSFYFDVPPNDTASRAYALTNARIGIERTRWSAGVYARNLFDRGYAVRGFYFGNEPPAFPNKLYTQLGAPREIGIVCDFRM